MNNSSEPRALLVSVRDATQLLGVGRTKVNELLQAGHLASLRIGRRRLICRNSIDGLVQQARQEAVPNR